MKKLARVALTSVMIASVVSACGNNAGNTPSTTDNNSSAAPKSANDKISGTITFLSNRTDMVNKEYVEYAKRFNAKYPNAQVKFEAVTDHEKNIKIRMASGDLPDVTLIPNIPLSDLSKTFAPLDDLGLNDKIYFKDYRAYNGHVYGISVGAMATGIVYNKKAFADAGITSVPKTLDEFYAAAEKLKQKGIIPLASNFKDQWPLYGWASELPISIAGNPNLNNERGKTDKPYTMDNAYGKAMSMLKTMHEKGYLEPDVNSSNWEQSKKDVASGKMAMYFLGNWVIPQVVEAGTTSDNVGFFPLPYDNSGKTNVTLSPDWAYGVNKDSKNLETAKAFVKWMVEESGFEDFAGFIPVLKDKKANVPQLKEFDSFNPTKLELAADAPEVMDQVNRAQIVKEALVQEFVLHNNPQQILDKYNERFAKAKK